MIKPWRYGAVDYERAIGAGLGTLELSGRPSVSPWDEDLAPAMAAAGRAVYEEQVLGDLLRDVPIATTDLAFVRPHLTRCSALVLRWASGDDDQST